MTILNSSINIAKYQSLTRKQTHRNLQNLKICVLLKTEQKLVTSVNIFGDEES